MKNFGLSEDNINFVKELLYKYLPENTSAYIFGSRANGTNKKYSDLDIALDYAGQQLPNNMILKIAAEFDNSTFPYEVDIVDLNNIQPSFKESIINDLKIL